MSKQKSMIQNTAEPCYYMILDMHRSNEALWDLKILHNKVQYRELTLSQQYYHKRISLNTEKKTNKSTSKKTNGEKLNLKTISGHSVFVVTGSETLESNDLLAKWSVELVLI